MSLLLLFSGAGTAPPPTLGVGIQQQGERRYSSRPIPPPPYRDLQVERRFLDDIADEELILLLAAVKLRRH